MIKLIITVGFDKFYPSSCWLPPGWVGRLEPLLRHLWRRPEAAGAGRGEGGGVGGRPLWRGGAGGDRGERNGHFVKMPVNGLFFKRVAGPDAVCQSVTRGLCWGNKRCFDDSDISLGENHQGQAHRFWDREILSHKRFASYTLKL